MDSQTLIILGVIVVVVVVGVFFIRRRLIVSTGLADGIRWRQIEDILLAADVGVGTTTLLVAELKSLKPETSAEAKSQLRLLLAHELGTNTRELALDSQPSVILVVGVNGTGKTTTIAKLANRLHADGHSVVLGAADTFRAAAGAQLEMWAGRIGLDVVVGQEGGDAAAVAFDTVVSAKAKTADVAIIDTAGRLHAKRNLMEELKKLHRVAGGNEGVDEVLLVLDATAGQNGLVQVREFADAVPLTGIVLAKLDGTAKGGIVFAIERELGVPVKFVGVGEGIADLEVFEPESFVDALLEDL